MSNAVEDIVQSALAVFPGAVRRGDDGDAILGVRPGIVLEPATAEDVAAALAWASRERLRVVLRGGGTRLEWARRPAAVDVVLSLARLNRVLAHPHGDLTASVEAGAPIRSVNHALAAHRQWLPIDECDAASTIGGAIATNSSGPLRHRYGTPRDLVIGIRLATTDGQLAKAGGNVVKNVAGYDLGKLMSGSYGSLAAIVSATFKLSPIPASSKTVSLRFADGKTAAEAVNEVTGSQLEPAALDVRLTASGRPGERLRCVLHVRFASVPEAVDDQIVRLRDLLRATDSEIVSGEREREVWDGQQDTTSKRGAVIRVSWLPANLAAVAALVEQLARDGGCAIDLTGRAGVGGGFLHIDADGVRQRQVLERLDASRDSVGNLFVLRVAHEAADLVSHWGAAGAAAPLRRALKATFDPAGILNAGQDL